ncbi:MAG TPA: nitroreductase family protein [Ktedonobacteraceae bacterium]|nr:nitroreductase family protein [Ktedonobacteraceae bacterium]
MSETTSGESTSIYPFAPLQFERLEPEEALRRSRAFLESMRGRRSIRAFSPEPVPFELIENAIATAATAPSGANQQPWRFVVVRDPELKRRMREIVEQEERESYEHRFPPEWLSALTPLGTDWHKEFIEIVPYVIVAFKEDYGLKPVEQEDQTETPAKPTEKHIKHYYVTESVGIAVGFLIASLQQTGLAVLTHTPSPMGFLRELLGRPRNEKPFVVLPVGYPAPDCRVPVLSKKSLDEVMIVK